jgi:hypothetical protein
LLVKYLWFPFTYGYQKLTWKPYRRFSYISRSSVEIRDLWVYSFLVTFVSKASFFFAPLVYTIAAVGIIYTLSQLFVRLISKEL